MKFYCYYTKCLALKVKFKLRTRLNEIKSGQWTIVIPVKQEIPLKEII